MKIRQTKTLKQAKLQALIFSLIMLAITVTHFIVGSVLATKNSLIGIILIVMGFLWGGVTVWDFFYSRKRVKRSFCPACGTKYDYVNDISWDEMNQNASADKIVSEVRMECHCPSCGRTDAYFQKFTIARYDKNKGQWTRQDIVALMRNYFIK